VPFTPNTLAGQSTSTADLRGEALAELSLLAGRRTGESSRTRGAATTERATRQAEELRKRLTTLAQTRDNAAEEGDRS
jgi:hypothetical protein